MKSKYNYVNEADKEFSLIQHITEVDSLIDYLSSKKLENFIEIGSHKGGTYYCLASLIQGKKISIDFCDGNFGGIGKEEAKKRNSKLKKIFDNTYFIEGMSADFNTIKKIKDILGDEKVSVLFIDGDHTLDGCLKDLLIYRQFVKQDGYIIFHDVKKTKFHTELNCRVDLIWKLLKDFSPKDCVEFVTGNKDDCSISVASASMVEWGGIGLIPNNAFYQSKNTHIFQVFYDNESLNLCLERADKEQIRYMPELVINNEFRYFENNIIEKVYNNYTFKSGDKIGVTSPILKEKVRLSVRKLIEICERENEKDIIIYSPDYSYLGLKGLHIWKNGKLQWANMYFAAEYLNKENILPFDLFKKRWYECYCNYWVAKKEIFEYYCKEVLTPSITFLSSEKFKNFEKENNLKLNHRGKDYPITVFILEGLFGSMIANRDYKIYDVFNGDNPEPIEREKYHRNIFNKKADMEKTISGTGKELETEVNKWLKKGWKIEVMNPCKQIICNADVVENIEEVLQAIKECKPVSIKTKNNISVQNAVMFYEYWTVKLIKDKK